MCGASRVDAPGHFWRQRPATNDLGASHPRARLSVFWLAATLHALFIGCKHQTSASRPRSLPPYCSYIPRHAPLPPPPPPPPPLLFTSTSSLPSTPSLL